MQENTVPGLVPQRRRSSAVPAYDGSVIARAIRAGQMLPFGRTLLACFLLFFAGRTAAQVSPGPLARPHEELDSTLKCLSCHGQGGKEALRERCVACHEEIAWLIANRRGYHAQKSPEDCSKCHRDHKGRDFELIHWEGGSPERFDHAQTGWPLQGKHAAAKCRDCHEQKRMTARSAQLLKRKNKAQGWIGLDTACLSCHKDAHRGALGEDCARCHGSDAWKPASAFDHAKSGYPLTGKHADVACNKCHMAASLTLPRNEAGGPAPLFKPLPHAECSACHLDPHASRLGTMCSRCHVTDSFAQVPSEKFNHDLTRYPLRGKHAALKCAQCHDPEKAWGKKPRFASCDACHRDAHAGSATLAGKSADCAACHRVEGFKPSTFTVTQHQSSKYPLAGKHASVACEKCHRKNPPGVPAAKLGTAGVLMRPAHAVCRDCHADSHGGQLAKRDHGGACESCHKVDGWKPSTFSVAEHARLRLPLDGRHRRVDCAACHGPARKGLPALPPSEKLGSARVALVLGEVECAACHVDPHEGRFGPKGARPKPDGCLSCHGVDAFRPSRVDVAAHGDFAYPLRGAHRAVACDACHAESKTPPQKATLVLAASKPAPMPFTTKGVRCEACHENPHGDQFASRADRGACESCHGEDGFRPASRFDHNRAAAFPLEGAHAKVPCARCHTSRVDEGGRKVVVFRPVSKACVDCHGGKEMKPLKRGAKEGRS